MVVNTKINENQGPLGLGDPDDTRLRKVEEEVLIPKKMRDKARSDSDKCLSQVTEFNKCAKENGLSVVFNCRKENQVMKDCLTYWFRNEDFKNLCTQEYLQQRAEYRSTGMKSKNRIK